MLSVVVVGFMVVDAKRSSYNRMAKMDANAEVSAAQPDWQTLDREASEGGPTRLLKSKHDGDQLPTELKLDPELRVSTDAADAIRPLEAIQIETLAVEPTVSAWEWAALDQTPSFTVSEQVTQKTAVTFDAASLKQVTQGDRVDLPLPAGQQYTAQVDHVKTMPNGDRNWQGHLADTETHYPVVFTLGTATAFATITTPEGSYTLETVGGSGWVYKNPQDAELSTEGFVDALPVPQP